MYPRRLPQFPGLLLGGLILALCIATGQAAEAPGPDSTTAPAGRYQALSVPHPGSFEGAETRARVFILDTVEGHLWLWSENETLYDPAGPPRFGTVLIYQGRLRPGTRMGEVLDKFIER